MLDEWSLDQLEALGSSKQESHLSGSRDRADVVGYSGGVSWASVVFHSMTCIGFVKQCLIEETPVFSGVCEDSHHFGSF